MGLAIRKTRCNGAQGSQAQDCIYDLDAALLEKEALLLNMSTGLMLILQCRCFYQSARC